MHRAIDTIIIHCAYTTPSMDIGVAEIDGWHRDRGWDGIGYHMVIRRNGVVEAGRDTEKAGAHAKGHNAGSIGVCLVGGKAEDEDRADTNFTAAQWKALAELVALMRMDFPGVKIIGHRDVDSGKTCPTFDVTAWASNLKV